MVLESSFPGLFSPGPASAACALPTTTRKTMRVTTRGIQPGLPHQSPSFFMALSPPAGCGSANTRSSPDGLPWTGPDTNLEFMWHRNLLRFSRMNT